MKSLVSMAGAIALGIVVLVMVCTLAVIHDDQLALGLVVIGAALAYVAQCLDAVGMLNYEAMEGRPMYRLKQDGNHIGLVQRDYSAPMSGAIDRRRADAFVAYAWAALGVWALTVAVMAGAIASLLVTVWL